MHTWRARRQNLCITARGAFAHDRLRLEVNAFGATSYRQCLPIRPDSDSLSRLDDSGSSAIDSEASPQDSEDGQESPRLRHDQESWAAAKLRAELTQSVHGITDGEAEVVADAVTRAHWSANRQNGPADWGTIPVFLVATVAIAANWNNIFNSVDFDNYPFLGYLVLAFGVLAIFAASNTVISTTYRAPTLIALPVRALALAAVIFLALWEGWRSSVLEIFGKIKSADNGFQNVLTRADVPAFYAVRIFAIILVYGITLRAVAWIASQIGPREPKNVVASAHLLLEIQMLVIVSQRLIDNEHEDETQQGFRQYLVRTERKELIRCLDRIARLAEGSWRRSLKVHDRIADEASGRLAAGIAEAARRWKPAAAIGGRRLEDMHKSFVSGLVAASQENWDALATDVSEREFLARRLLRLARHIVAAAILVGAIFVIAVRPFEWLQRSTPGALDSLLFVAALVLSLTIDPAITDRLTRAIRLDDSLRGAGDFKSS